MMNRESNPSNMPLRELYANAQTMRAKAMANGFVAFQRALQSLLGSRATLSN